MAKRRGFRMGSHLPGECYFRAMRPSGAEWKDFPVTRDGFHDAVDYAKSNASVRDMDVNLVCFNVGAREPYADAFLVTCTNKHKTCTTMFSARPHGGLGRARRRRR